MDLIARVKGILLEPKKEWHIIKHESISINDMMIKYALILALLPAIAGIIRYSSFGFPISAAVRFGVLTYALNIGGIFLIAYLMDILAPSFGSTKNYNDSMKTVVFAATPNWIGGIFSGIYIISIISFLAGIYSLFLLYVGMDIVKNPPKEKLTGYFIITILLALAVFIIIGAIGRGVYI